MPPRPFVRGNSRFFGQIRHAIAIDERRASFERVPWGIPGQWKGGKPVWFEQVWFAGNHSDIGGSYAEDESRLSDIALGWMVDAADEVGLLHDPAVLRCYPDATAMQHDESKSSVFRFAAKKVRATMPDAPLHPTVLERFAAKEVLHYDVMFAGGASTTATYWGDVDSSYEAVTSFKQGTAGGRHIVRAGETLQSIAQATWGDSSYWYKIAEANGLNADSFLAEGQSLAIPAGAVRTKNNASTFKPYDASEAIGDTAPTRVKPPKPKKSGLLGKLLIAAIAIAVVAIVAPWAAGFVAHDQDA